LKNYKEKQKPPKEVLEHRFFTEMLISISRKPAVKPSLGTETFSKNGAAFGYEQGQGLTSSTNRAH
jgi:hypothetical protein